eukprot:m.145932 g.145932  ORF g.145932 m.145932 type:complete len:741 (+) comp38436_c0_seq2:168-2390(+)
MQQLRHCIAQVKEKCTKGREIPVIVDKIQSDFLIQLRLVLLTESCGEISDPIEELLANGLLPESLIAKGLSIEKMRDALTRPTWRPECEEALNFISILSADEGNTLDLFDLPPDEQETMIKKIDDFNRKDRCVYEQVIELEELLGIRASEFFKLDRHFFPSAVFRSLMSGQLSQMLGDDIKNLLLEFLNDLGEVVKLEGIVIFDPTWLCHTIIGSVISPDYFDIHVERFRDGIITKGGLGAAIQAFCKHQAKSSVNVDEAVKVLCQLNLCYPITEKQNEFLVPALLAKDRRPECWDRREEMVVYVGRRLQCSNDVDIICPGAFHLIQLQAGLTASQQPVEFWSGGMVITKIVGRSRKVVEALVEFQDNGRAVDVVVRGRKFSESRCVTFSDEIRRDVMKALRDRSPGTTTEERYLSWSQIKEHLVKPLAHSSSDVEVAKATGPSPSVSTKISDSFATDSLRDLLAVPSHHFSLSSLTSTVYASLNECLDGKDRRWWTLGLRLGVDVDDLQSVRAEAFSSPVEEVLNFWSGRLDATLANLREALVGAGMEDVVSTLERDGVSFDTHENQHRQSILHDDILARPLRNTAFVADKHPEQFSKACGQERAMVADVSSSGSRDATVKDTGMSHLQDVVTDNHLQKLYLKVDFVWKNVASFLGPEKLTPAEVQRIKKSKEYEDDGERCLFMLRKWQKKQKEKGVEGTIWDILFALLHDGVELNDVAEKVFGKDLVDTYFSKKQIGM